MDDRDGRLVDRWFVHGVRNMVEKADMEWKTENKKRGYFIV